MCAGCPAAATRRGSPTPAKSVTPHPRRLPPSARPRTIWPSSARNGARYLARSRARRDHRCRLCRPPARGPGRLGAEDPAAVRGVVAAVDQRLPRPARVMDNNVPSGGFRDQVKWGSGSGTTGPGARHRTSSLTRWSRLRTSSTHATARGVESSSTRTLGLKRDADFLDTATWVLWARRPLTGLLLVEAVLHRQVTE